MDGMDVRGIITVHDRKFQLFSAYSAGCTPLCRQIAMFRLVNQYRANIIQPERFIVSFIRVFHRDVDIYIYICIHTLYRGVYVNKFLKLLHDVIAA